MHCCDTRASLTRVCTEVRRAEAMQQELQRLQRLQLVEAVRVGGQAVCMLGDIVPTIQDRFAFSLRLSFLDSTSVRQYFLVTSIKIYLVT